MQEKYDKITDYNEFIQENKMDYYLHNDPEISNAAAPFFTHEYINYFAIKANKEILNLKPVGVKENPNFDDWKIGPKHKDFFIENSSQIRSLDKNKTFDCIERNGEYKTEVPEGVEVEPWKILIYYSTEPDMLLDCDLNLHWSQKLTGGSHGYRHMTFSLFGKKFGDTFETLFYYINAAKKSKEQGNEYWKWRFLSRATHYLADLGHPFHTKVVPYRKLMKKIISLKKLMTTIIAAHNSHEVYVQYEFRQENPVFKENLIRGTLDGLKNSILLEENNNDYTEEKFRKDLIHYRRKSAKLLTPMFKILTEDFGDQLINIYNFELKENEIEKNKMDEKKDEEKDEKKTSNDYKNHPGKKQDLSKQTLLVEEEVQKLIILPEYKENRVKLEKLTAKALYNVGIMFGNFFVLIKNMGLFN